MNPAMDAESYYASLPETLGECPFCHKIVQETDDYVWSNCGRHVTHMECLDSFRDYAFIGEIAPCVEDEEDMAFWERRFTA